MSSRSLATISAFLLCLSVSSPAQTIKSDWPQWRGPERTGISQEKGLLKQWPKEGPKLLWQVNDIGDGFSTPSVVGSRIYLMSNRGMENEFVQALSTQDGKVIWTTRVGNVGNPNQNPSYPKARSTPTVDGNLLYALGSDGDLVCLETLGGKVRWQKSLRKEFEGQPHDWAYAESPLVDGDVLVVTPGGAKEIVQLGRELRTFLGGASGSVEDDGDRHPSIATSARRLSRSREMVATARRRPSPM